MNDGNISAEAVSPDALSSTLGAILSNPDMLGMISSLAKDLRDSSQSRADVEAPASEAISPSPSPSAESDVGALIGRLAPLLSAAPASSKKEDDRACLLRALKPYLSEGRGEAIDYIIKFSVLAKALRKLS